MRDRAAIKAAMENDASGTLFLIGLLALNALLTSEQLPRQQNNTGRSLDEWQVIARMPLPHNSFAVTGRICRKESYICLAKLVYFSIQ